jgi:hypothetical protein
MKRSDLAAGERAIAAAMRMSEARAEQVADKLKSEPRTDVMLFAAGLCQDAALKLAPWQMPPCEIDPAQIDAILEEGDTIDNATFYGGPIPRPP